jgi:hypothetical protein
MVREVWPDWPWQVKLTVYWAPALAAEATRTSLGWPETSSTVLKTPEEAVTEGTSHPEELSLTSPPALTVPGLTAYLKEVMLLPEGETAETAETAGEAARPRAAMAMRATEAERTGRERWREHM